MPVIDRKVEIFMVNRDQMPKRELDLRSTGWEVTKVSPDDKATLHFATGALVSSADNPNITRERYMGALQEHFSGGGSVLIARREMETQNS